MYEHQENERGELVPSSGWIGFGCLSQLYIFRLLHPEPHKPHSFVLYLTPRIPRRHIPLFDALALL